MAIKSKLLNKYRKLFYNTDKKVSSKQFYESFTPEQRLQIFVDLFGDVREIHNELNDLKRKRKFRAKIEKLRAERGYVRKKKTPKDQAPVPVEVKRS